MAATENAPRTRAFGLRAFPVSKATLAAAVGLTGERDTVRLLGKLLRAEEVAELLSVELSTVRAWTRRREIPCVKIGPRGVRYRLLHVLAFIEARTRPALRQAERAAFDGPPKESIFSYTDEDAGDGGTGSTTAP